MSEPNEMMNRVYNGRKSAGMTDQMASRVYNLRQQKKKGCQSITNRW